MKSLNFLSRLAAIAALACFMLVACTKDKDYSLSSASSNPAPNAIEPGEGAANTAITLTGTGLGDIRSIVFDSGHILADVNPAFNTDNALLFRIPLEAIPAQQNIVFTNGLGKSFSIPFKVIALPLITGVSNYNFTQDGTLVLTGKYLDDVVSVTFAEDPQVALTVVAKTATSLTVKFPQTTLTRSKLVVVNTAGAMTTTQEFVNLDLAYGVFKDAFGAGIDDWSWGTANSVSTENVKSGTTALKVAYNGTWGGLSLHFGTPVSLSAYKYVSFWIKGASVEKKLSNFNFNWGTATVITVPPNVWTYYKIDLKDMGGPASLGDWVMQIENEGQTLYMDDMILIK